MKEIDLKQRNYRPVVSYSPWMIWGASGGAALLLIVNVLLGNLEPWPAFLSAFCGFIIGAMMALRFPNAR